jgi:hypothetical protein
MVAQSAVWALVVVLTWTETAGLFGDAFKRRQRLRVLGPLAVYLAAYALLLWFPQRLIGVISSDELASPLDQRVPLAHYPIKDSIFSAIQFAVVLFPVAGIWLADWRIRNRIAANNSEEECFSALLEMRSLLLNLGAALTMLVAFSFLGLVFWGEALKQHIPFPWFSRPPLVVYGLYLTVLVAISYIPAYFNLLAAGREVRDRFYPRLLPSAPEYERQDTHRRKVDDLLKLQLRAKESLKVLATILVPVATSLVYALLGLKQ